MINTKTAKVLKTCVAAFLLMVAMSLTTSVLSFFVMPVCTELGFSRSAFTLYYSMMVVTGGFSVSFLGQYINKNGVQRIVLTSSIWCGIGLSLLSFANRVWEFYLIAALLGIFASSCVSLCSNIIVQQCYTRSEAASLLGFVSAGSGIGGMVFSLIVPTIITRFGWRNGYRFMGGCWFVLVFAAFLIFGKTELKVDTREQSVSEDGMTRAQALRSPKLYLLMVVIFVCAAGVGIQQHLASLLGGAGFSTSEVSMMISMSSVFLAAGKIVQGLLYSKLGVKVGGSMMLCVYAAGYILLLVDAPIYLTLVVLACGLGVLMTLMPTAARFAFGSREYPAIWSILATASSIGSFAGSPLWGLAYDLSGSYVPALIIAPIALMVALIAYTLSFQKKKNG